MLLSKSLIKHTSCFLTLHTDPSPFSSVGKILTPDMDFELRQLLNMPFWSMCYSAIGGAAGCGYASRTNCNNRGQFVMIAQTTTGQIIGGYSDGYLSSCSCWLYGSNSMIFKYGYNHSFYVHRLTLTQQVDWHHVADGLAVQHPRKCKIGFITKLLVLSCKKIKDT